MFEGMKSARANGMPTKPPPDFIPNHQQAKKIPQGGPPYGGPQQGPTKAGPPKGPPYGAPKGAMLGKSQDKMPIYKYVDPGAIAPCRYRYVYIWPRNARGFWAYITYVGPRSIAGWRYRRGRWQYFGMDLRRVEEFYCN